MCSSDLNVSHRYSLWLPQLQRLLTEFAPLRHPPEPGDLATTLPDHARRLHKLAGHASLVGAEALAGLARSASTLAATGPADLAPLLALDLQIAGLLDALHRDSLALGLCHSPVPDEPAAGRAPIAEDFDSAGLMAWCGSLAVGSDGAGALSRYPALRPHLARQLPEAALRALDAHLAVGDLAGALRLVERSGLTDMTP